jgi:hypothetical protein
MRESPVATVEMLIFTVHHYHHGLHPHIMKILREVAVGVYPLSEPDWPDLEVLVVMAG